MWWLRRRWAGVALAGAGSLIIAALAMSSVGGLPSLSTADGPSVPDVEVELPAAAPAPQPGPMDDHGLLGSTEPVSCAVDDCIAWEVELGSGALLAGEVLPVGDLLIVAHPGVPAVDAGAGSGSAAAGGTDPDELAGGLLAIDAGTGEPRWELEHDPTGEGREPPVVVVEEDRLYLVREPGTLTAFGLDDLRTHWRAPIGDVSEVRQAERIGPDLLVVLASPPAEDGTRQRVVALDPETGTERWSSPGVTEVVLTSAGPVLFDAFDAMSGLDPEDGSERWRAPLRTVPSDIVVLGGVLVLGPVQGTVVDAASGEVIATLPQPWDGVFDSPRPADTEGLLVVGATALTHVTPEGSVWTVPVEDCCLGWNLAPEALTLLRADGTLERYAREDGRELDRQPVGRPGERPGQPSLLFGEHLFVIDGHQRAFEVWIEEPSTGRMLARPGAAYPVGLTGEGALLLGRPDRLVALRPPHELAEAADIAP